jgi:hypothetical protein
MNRQRINVVRGIGGSGIREYHDTETGGSYGVWTNVVNWGTGTPTGDDPIDIILKMLMSTGTQTNYAPNTTNYDVYQYGIGLGIPYDQIDLDSFIDIKNQYDWDVNQRLFFRIAEPEPAKAFIDQELCRPFGLYLKTGNDGLIRCVRPRHPQKFYVGDGNRILRVRFPHLTGTEYDAKLEIGVYDAFQIADAVAKVLNDLAISSVATGFSCTYDPMSGRFSLGYDRGIFDIGVSPDFGWTMLGMSVASGQTSYLSSPRGLLPPEIQAKTLTEDDMWSVQVIENSTDQITSVTYCFDYDIDSKKYQTQRPFADPEGFSLSDTFGARDYTINSRGLISSSEGTINWVSGFVPGDGCRMTPVRPSRFIGVDADTWSKLYALTLLDRYKKAPIKFRANLRWNWNSLELGDIVRVDYSLPGVFADYELNQSVLSNRLFEVVELHPNYDGSLVVTFLGHRHVGY